MYEEAEARAAQLKADSRQARRELEEASCAASEVAWVRVRVRDNIGHRGARKAARVRVILGL